MPLVINGATSGSTTIQATDAVTATITLPSATGTVQLANSALNGSLGATTPSSVVATTINASGDITLSTTGIKILWGAGVDFIQTNTSTHNMVINTNSVESMRINSAGGVQHLNTISVGNATPSTSGAGITFPATQSASTDANTLDDYEEGTWTPTVTAISGSYTTVTGQKGSYTKIGRKVTLNWYFIVTNKGTGAGFARITNLPFVSNVSADNYYSGNGYDTSALLEQVASMTTTNAIDMIKYDGTDPIVAPRGQVGQLTYFTA